MKETMRKLSLLVAILIAFTSMVKAQDVAVSGKVVDQSGIGLPGVNVVIKGTTNGTISNIEGNYSIMVQTGNVLIFSFIGFDNQEITYSNQSKIDVILENRAIGVDEVVVVGYGTQKKVNLTGAVSSVTFKESVNQPVTNSSQLLYGQVSGVQLTQGSGMPGSDESSIIIRGVGTFGSSNPLIVIDGMQFSDLSEFNALAPSDIESISVLKDASASAIYGARGANGVIVVTTKKGKSGEMKIEYNNYFGWQEATVVPEYLDSYNYAVLMNEAVRNANGADAEARYLDGQLEQIKDGTNPDSFANTSWPNVILEKAPIQNHYLAISGGTEKIQYRIGLGYLNQDAIIVGKHKQERYNFRVNLNAEVKEWLTISNILNSTLTKYKAPTGGSSLLTRVINQFSRTAPTIPVYLSDGGYGRIDGAYNNSEASFSSSNPLKDLNRGNFERNTYKISDQLRVRIEPLKGLSIISSVTLNLNFVNLSDFKPSTSKDDIIDPSSKNKLRNRAEFNYQILNENIIKYTQKIRKHSFTLMGGHSVMYRQNDNFEASLSGFPTNSLEEFNGGGVEPSDVKGTLTEIATQSFFGRLNYSYKNKYLFEANVRRDGSSKFSNENLYGTFPSMSAGWRISEERFLENLYPVVSNLKLRGSWGKSGNDRIGNYIFQQKYSIPNYVLGTDDLQVNGIAINKLANSTIEWEETEQYDIGLDIGFFKNRLQVVADFYNRKSSRVLYDNFPVSSVLGVSNLEAQNSADLLNRGWELAVNYNGNAGNFKYGLNFNITNTLKSEVTSLGAGGEETISGGTIVKVGEPFRAYYGYRAIGIFQTEEEVAGAPVQFGSSNVVPGDLRYADINEDNKVDAQDRVVIGNPYPKWIFGFAGNSSYRGFDMSFVFQGVKDIDRYMEGNGQGMTDDRTNPLSYVLNRWTPDNTDTDIPRVGNITNQKQVSSYFVEDASFVRLKNLEIGYSLPNKWLEKIHIDKFRIFAGAQNLLTFTKMENFDPERKGVYSNSDSNIDRKQGSRSTPLYKTYTFGLNLTF